MQMCSIILSHHQPMPVHSIDQFHEVIESIFNIIYSFDDDSAIIILAGALYDLDDHIGHCVINWISSDSYNSSRRKNYYCSPSRMISKTKQLSVIALNGLDACTCRRNLLIARCSYLISRTCMLT